MHGANGVKEGQLNISWSKSEGWRLNVVDVRVKMMTVVLL